jgi:membrane-bound metal-dependent hydrolase YbcI (DUF457 family)
MASFKTHISFGLAAGVLGVILLAGLSAGHVPDFFITVFVVATLGSVLPDIDSDSGLPFHVAFGSLTIVVCALVFIHFYNIQPRDMKVVLAWTAGTSIFVWGIMGYIFRRFTEHRGIAHSIPAALLAGLGTFFLATRFHFSEENAFILAIAMLGGFLTHLILDEIWAVVNWNGTMFIPNRAFGTALKFFSESRMVNLLVYGAIFMLMYGNYAQFNSLAQDFLLSVRK